jgi:hypothetical protein
VWSCDTIADLVADALAAREQSLREEQAVYGLDALDETEVHPVIARGLARAGLGVLREQPYPTQWKRKRKDGSTLPLPRDRERCDIVLTPRPDERLRDSLAVAKGVAKRRAEVSGTLFELVGSAPDPEPAGVSPDEAYWLELKVVAQYSVESGVPGPNRAYASQITRFAAGDIAKLSCDRTIVHGGLALVLFTADTATAAHDSAVLMDRLIERGLRVAAPSTRSFPIQDRIGNALCSVVLVPLRPAPPLDDD